MSDRGFEIMLSVMIIVLCCTLANFGVMPESITQVDKYCYYTFFSICLWSAVMIIIMNIINARRSHNDMERKG